MGRLHNIGFTPGMGFSYSSLTDNGKEIYESLVERKHLQEVGMRIFPLKLKWRINVDKDIEEIHKNIINGNRRDAVKLINEYGTDFFSEYVQYLKSWDEALAYSYFKDAVLSYFRIKRR